MYYVYVIKSVAFPEKTYVGYSTNLKQRLSVHNAGGSYHTAKYTPWELVVYIGFVDKSAAMAFEKYLKSNSGREFTQKRFFAKP